MIRTLLWKEYREQRMTAVVLAITTVGAMYGARIFATSERYFDDIFNALTIALAWFVGLILGAQPFANEIENRTQSWIDMLPASRSQISKSKLLIAAGITLVHALVLLVVGLCTKWLDHGFFAELCLLVIGFAIGGVLCGISGSMLAKSPLGAVGWAILLQFPAVLITFLAIVLLRGPLFSESKGHFSAIVFATAISVPFVFTWRRYTYVDRQRTFTRKQVSNGESWRSLLWLAWKQSHLNFWIVASVGILGAFLLVFRHWHDRWAPVAMALGIIATIGTFSADRRGEAYQFFGDRRIPYRQLWLIKVGLRLVIALIPIACYAVEMLAYLGSRSLALVDRNNTDMARDIESFLNFANLLLFPLTGFAIGLFCDFVCRKAPIAVFLSLVVGTGMLFLWWPSVIVGGLYFWQWIIAPVVLIVATALSMRAFVSGRLATTRPIFGLVAAGCLAVGATTLGIWYRVAEVPTARDPFDVAAFEKSLPKPEDNGARLILLPVLKSFRKEVLLGSDKQDQISTENRKLISKLFDVVADGRWPDDKELDRQLDELIAHPWFEQFRKAVQVPLGMLIGLGNHELYLEHGITDSPHIANVLTARALQLASRGQSAEAFDEIFRALHLSRHIRSKPTTGWIVGSGVSIEERALSILPALIQSAADKPELLASAIERLQAHSRAVPGIDDAMKLDYLESIRDDPLAEPSYRYTWTASLRNSLWATKFPWEQTRAKRILSEYYAGCFRAGKLQFPAFKKQIDLQRFQSFDDHGRTWYVSDTWVSDSSDTRSSAQQFREICHLLRYSWWNEWSPRTPERLFIGHFFSRAVRNGAAIQLALAAYQMKHKKHVEKLTDLVPEFLSELPSDPYSENTFKYRISTGERIVWKKDNGELKRVITPGDGLLWSVGPDLKDNDAMIAGFTGRWHNNPEDIVFIIPKLTH